MVNKIKAKITRRSFIEGTVAISALFLMPQISYAAKYDYDSADGLLSIEEDGKIHIYSGAGNMGLYAKEDILHILSDIFNCSNDYFIIENGPNPDHLPTLLSQFSNHLSFSNGKTNLYSARFLIHEMKMMMVENFGGSINDYQIKNGHIFSHNINISFADLTRLANGCFIKGHICHNTVIEISKIKKNSIIVAVTEII